VEKLSAAVAQRFMNDVLLSMEGHLPIADRRQSLLSAVDTPRQVFTVAELHG
jgi:hypothetical protein